MFKTLFFQVQFACSKNCLDHDFKHIENEILISARFTSKLLNWCLKFFWSLV